MCEKMVKLEISKGFKGVKAHLKPVFFLEKHSKESASRIAEKTISELKEVFKDDILLEPLILTEDMEFRTISDRVEPFVDALILPMIGRRYNYRKVYLVNKPVILWQDKGYSHAATWDTRGFLKAWGVNAIAPIGLEEHKKTVQVISAINALKKSKMIVFGRIPAPNVASQWSLEKIEKKLGIEVKNIGLGDVLRKSQELDTAIVIETLEQWKPLFENFDANRLEEVVRLYLAIKDILHRENANSFTINCLEDLFSQKFIPPCIALARFIDEGIVAGCEADINVALSMVILSYISRGPSIMGNIYLFRPWSGPGFPPVETRIEDVKESLKTNVVRLTHDVIPLSMGTSSKWVLEDYHNKGAGNTAYVPLKTGERVTLMRISPDLNEMLVIKGKIIKVEDSIHCRFSAWIKVNDARAIADNAYAFHHAMIYGDWTRELELFGKILNIKVNIV